MTDSEFAWLTNPTHSLRHRRFGWIMAMLESAGMVRMRRSFPDWREVRDA